MNQIIYRQRFNGLKIFMDFDKPKSTIFINYFMEEEKIVIKIPIAKNGEMDNMNIILNKFDISDKIYLIDII